MFSSVKYYQSPVILFWSIILWEQENLGLRYCQVRPHLDIQERVHKSSNHSSCLNIVWGDIVSYVKEKKYISVIIII